ncbi:MAG: UDP-N-acetylmuramoyl-L-alanine--D-glutamate ligase [Parvibaculaceae bacterium]|nr:UDP-N-acetylmuramoyl-L-alanine--D-glutamate ligase [Parvibaculaceae bacterium]
MIVAAGFEGRTIAVFGLARSGIATVRSLAAGGARVLAWDDSQGRRADAQALGLPLENLYEADWSEISALVLSPGVPLTHPEPHALVQLAHAAGAAVIGDIEIFFRAVRASPANARIVGITGTNGKSTTTALIGHMVEECGGRVAVGGNIGTAVLELEPPRDGLVYVIELSSYQIDLAPSLAPDVAILINITPDHIDRHGSLEHYAEVKANIFAHQTRGQAAICGIDDELSADICTTLTARHEATVVPVSVGQTVGKSIYVVDGTLYDSTDLAIIKVGDLRGLRTLAGAHNWQNAAMAYAAGRALGFDRERILHSFRHFPGLAHRMEIVAERDHVRFVNDSKGTNADATRHALAAYDNIFWIVGGKAKEGGIESLETLFPHVARAYLIGESSDDFAVTLEGKVPYARCGTLDVAVPQAARDARAGAGDLKIVMLSPACASFDQYPNFEVRGDAFRNLVQSLVKDWEGAPA